MKSISLVFLAAAAGAFYLAGAWMQATGASMLVASSVSAQTWTRSCAYAGPNGLVTLKVDGAERCPPTAGDRLPAGQARLLD